MNKNMPKDRKFIKKYSVDQIIGIVHECVKVFGFKDFDVNK